MISEKTFSVLITTRAPERRTTIGEVVGAWAAQTADQVWLLNCGAPLPAMKGARVFNLPVDPGTRTDYSMALLTTGDFVVLADDDVVVGHGFLEALFQGWQEAGARGLVGIIGRTFQGSTYWGETTFFRASLLDRPVRVGFVGVVILAPRELMAFDARGCPRNCDDLWLAMKTWPDEPKHVVPVHPYRNLAEAKGKSAMYRDPALREQRQQFYGDHYLKTYAPAGRKF